MFVSVTLSRCYAISMPSLLRLLREMAGGGMSDDGAAGLLGYDNFTIGCYKYQQTFNSSLIIRE